MKYHFSKQQLDAYTGQILDYMYNYCVELKLLDKDKISFDEFLVDYNKYLKYCRSDYKNKMSFIEFKVGDKKCD